METESKTETALTLKHAMLSTSFDKSEASKFLELIDNEVMSEVCDVSTVKGRTRERSLAAGISSFKVHMNKLALESIDTHMVIVKSTKAYLKEFNAESDERRDKRKAASIEQEAKEQARKDWHRAKIDSVKQWGENLQSMNLSALENRLDAVSGDKKVDFEEYSEEEDRVRKQTIENLNQAITTVKEFDAAAAELARLQQKEADDKAKIKKLEDDAKAAKQKLIDDAEALKAKEDRIAAEKQAVIDAAADLEAKKIIDKEIADEQEALTVARIEVAKKDALKLEQEKQAEAKRVADRAAEIKADQERELAEDKEHRSEVINQAIKAIHDGGNDSISISLDQASVVVDLIAAGFVPNTVINF